MLSGRDMPSGREITREQRERISQRAKARPFRIWQIDMRLRAREEQSADHVPRTFKKRRKNEEKRKKYAENEKSFEKTIDKRVLCVIMAGHEKRKRI
ncbi:MAG: hypothetical protein J5793_03345 [Clostridia bacterium]|nr:hypothetical protein [Clostridia bacterium]